MLENLFNLVKENSSYAVINNPAIPNEKNDEVVADATHSVAEGLQGILAGGGLQKLLSMFSTNNNAESSGLLSNPIVGNIISSFKNKLSDNYNVSGTEADNISNGLIPNVIGSLINKTNNPNDSSFSIGSIINSLTGTLQNGSGGGIGEMVSKFTAGSFDVNNDGQVGLDDLISKVTGGAKNLQQQNENTGGLFNTIKSFIK